MRAEADGPSEAADPGHRGRVPASRGGGNGKRRRKRDRLHPGTIIAAAARAGRQHWWRILCVAIPVTLASSGLEILVDHYVDPSDTLLSAGATIAATGVSLLGTVLLAGFIGRLAGMAEHGRDPLTFRQVVCSLPWLRLLGADVLVAAAVLAGLLLLVVPGLVILTLLSVVGPVIEIERPPIIAAMRRSAQLTRRHIGTVVLLATLPLLASGEVEAIAPEPGHASEIAEFLVIRGLAEGIVEAAIALVLVELCFQLIDAASRETS